jgi:hypothetical protein
MTSNKPQKLSPVTAKLRKLGYEKESPWEYLSKDQELGVWCSVFSKGTDRFQVMVWVYDTEFVIEIFTLVNRLKHSK